MDCLRFANGHFGHFCSVFPAANTRAYCSQDLAQADRRSMGWIRANEKKGNGRERKAKAWKRVRTRKDCLRQGGALLPKSPKKKKKRRKKNKKEKKEEEEEVEKEKEVEKPIVVRETKEICILSNCRLKVRERVWKHGGWKVEGGRAGQGGIR